jgi:septum site-determining protein MinD
VCEILALELLGVIPEDEEIIDTTNRGQPVVLEENNRLSSAYDNIARRLEGEIVPFMRFDQPGLLSRLFGGKKAG